ncbi:MAG: DUF4416 family protein [Syntrophales bacterium]
MSKPREPAPAKLVVSLFSGDRDRISAALGIISGKFGKADFISEFLPFNYTDYYRKEMGENLERRIASFEDLIRQDSLPDIKLFTNEVEAGFSEEGKRKINIDPGYMTEFNFVLASGKAYAHRLYLRNGIYADLTLIFRSKSFHPLEWTYPDYAGETIRGILSKIRKKYIYQLKGSGSPSFAKRGEGEIL